MLTLEKSLENIKAKKLPDLPNGKAERIKDVWDNIVVPNLLDADRIMKMFEILEQYVNDEDAVFAIRIGNSRNNGEGDKALRRGFITKAEYKDPKTNGIREIKYFYTDNDFATIIYKLMYDGNWTPNYKEFMDMMINGKFPVHFNPYSKCEKAKAIYPINGKSPGVGNSGYKVSHIFDVGQGYMINGQIMGIKAICDIFFPLGKYDEWNSANGYIRKSEAEITEEAVAFLKAEFLRFACPLNYILTPKAGKNRCHILDVQVPKNDIGEDKDLLEYAADKFMHLYDGYEKYIKSIGWHTVRTALDPGEKYVGMIYGKGIGKGETYSIAPESSKASKIKVPKSDKKRSKANYSEEQKLALIEDYLFNGTTLIELERRHLNPELKSKGGTASSVLTQYGIKKDGKGTENQGIFAGKTIEEAIVCSDITLVDILKKIAALKKKTTAEELKAVKDLLGKIGRKIFVDYYDDFKSCTDTKALAEKLLSENSDATSLDAQKTRISKAKQIFDNRLEKEALEIIIASGRLDPATIDKAKALHKSK